MSTETASAVKSTKVLKTWQKVGYGFAGIGNNYCWSFVATFVLLYCTNTAGLNSAVVGTLMLVSRVLDGITDVLFGHIIDKTRSRLGKARFWYLVSAFPTALFTFLTFNIPQSLPLNGKYVYFFVMYTLTGAVFYTMNSIACFTMAPRVTTDKDERTQLKCLTQFLGLAGVIVLSYCTASLVAYFGGGQGGWRAVSLIYAIICFVTLMIPFFSVHELPEEQLVTGNTAGSTDEVSFIETVKLLLKNRYFVLGLLYYIVCYAASGLFQGLGTYYATYCLGNSSYLGTVSVAGMLPTMLIIPFVPGLMKKFSVRWTAFAGFVLVLIGSVIAYFGALKASLPIILAALVLRSLGAAPMTPGIQVLLAEADDFSALKFGHHITGSMFSCTSMGIKVGTGIGTALCGFLLSFGQYDGTLAVQSSFTQSVILNAYFLPYVVYAVLSLIIVYFYDVEKRNVELRKASA